MLGGQTHRRRKLAEATGVVVSQRAAQDELTCACSPTAKDIELTCRRTDRHEHGPAGGEFLLAVFFSACYILGTEDVWIHFPLCPI